MNTNKYEHHLRNTSTQFVFLLNLQEIKGKIRLA